VRISRLPAAPNAAVAGFPRRDVAPVGLTAAAVLPMARARWREPHATFRAPSSFCTRLVLALYLIINTAYLYARRRSGRSRAANSTTAYPRRPRRRPRGADVPRRSCDPHCALISWSHHRFPERGHPLSAARVLRRGARRLFFAGFGRLSPRTPFWVGSRSTSLVLLRRRGARSRSLRHLRPAHQPGGDVRRASVGIPGRSLVIVLRRKLPACRPPLPRAAQPAGAAAVCTVMCGSW